MTEVHHINGEGENAGVVYCEMQGRENSGESRTHLALVRAMYPGKCGYKSETGGIMANLRDSTSHLKVIITRVLARLVESMILSDSLVTYSVCMYLYAGFVHFFF